MNLLSVHDINDEKLEKILSSAQVFRCQHELAKASEVFREQHNPSGFEGRVIGTLFLEPSTRTRWSFESAALRLGAKVVSNSSGGDSSLSKGETLEDTINTCAQYVDLLVVRSKHPLTDTYGNYLHDIPKNNIINAGDGGHEHPTQAILDAYTIWRDKKQLENLHIGIVGDLRHSRTIHSLIGLLGRKSSNTFTLFDPTGRELPRQYESLAPILTCESEKEFKSHVPKMDVVYLNRMQKERWGEPDTPVCSRHPNLSAPLFQFDHKYLEILPKDAMVMNPGPRLDEMPVLDDKRIVYYDQTFNGLFTRMSILCHVLLW